MGKLLKLRNPIKEGKANKITFSVSARLLKMVIYSLPGILWEVLKRNVPISSGKLDNAEQK